MAPWRWEGSSIFFSFALDLDHRCSWTAKIGSLPRLDMASWMDYSHGWVIILHIQYLNVISSNSIKINSTHNLLKLYISGIKICQVFFVGLVENNDNNKKN